MKIIINDTFEIDNVLYVNKEIKNSNYTITINTLTNISLDEISENINDIMSLKVIRENSEDEPTVYNYSEYNTLVSLSHKFTDEISNKILTFKKSE